MESVPPALIYLASAVLVYLVYVSVELYVYHKGRDKERRKAKCTGSIVVLIYSNRENFATACSIQNMIASALCPHRLSFAVVQHVNEATSIDVFELLREANSYYRNYTVKESQVRTITVYEDVGYGRALNMLVDLVREDTDDYVLFTEPGTVFVKDFDRVLLSPNASTIQTCHGPPFTNTTFAVPPGSRKQSVAAYYAATMPPRPVEKSKEVYFWGYNHQGHQIQYATPEHPIKSIKSIGCSPVCTFLPTSIVLAQPAAPEVEVPDGVLLSSFLHPQEVYLTRHTIAYERKKKKRGKSKEMKTLTPTPFTENVGIGYGVSLLGILNEGDTGEIFQKYGSMANFERMKSYYRID